MYTYRKLLFILGAFFCYTSYGQSGKSIYYLDHDFNLSVKEGSVYNAVGEYQEGKFKFVAVHNISKRVVLEGFFDDSTLTVKNGLFKNYTDEGVEVSRGVYVNNKEEGLWLRWSSGNLSDSVVFENGDAVLMVNYSYNSNNKITSRVYRDNKSKRVEQNWWDADGNLESLAIWIKGNGDRVTYYPNGNPGTIETFKNSKIVSTKHFKEDGTELTAAHLKAEQKKARKNGEGDPVNQQPVIDGSRPEYPGGTAGFSSYFTKNFKAPPSLFEQVRSIERVTVTFMLDKNGFATDIKVLEFSSLELYDAIREVFNRMPAWNMKGYKTFGPVTYTLNLQRGY